MIQVIISRPQSLKLKRSYETTYDPVGESNLY